TDASARHTGTVLHRTLQQVVAEGIDLWDAKRIEQQQRFWQIQLQQLGVPVEQLPAAIEQLGVALHNSLQDSRGQWILDHRHQDSQCELPLGYSTANNSHKLAVVDRTFIADGERWIVDYKNARPSDEQSLEDFTRLQLAHYQSQLQHYGKLFTELENRPVRLALYFPLVPHWVEVPVSQGQR
ncbi:MAG: PD-(D/E)XK nuclease family protein, partial [Porticoccaceae bacterium]|nr:PD-(D/E)XK nuclease family protein [Porticoccaceae bacterium]